MLPTDAADGRHAGSADSIWHGREAGCQSRRAESRKCVLTGRPDKGKRLTIRTAWKNHATDAESQYSRSGLDRPRTRPGTE
jgi:hypothetical protein